MTRLALALILPWVAPWLDVGPATDGPELDQYVIWPNAVGHIVGHCPDGRWHVVVANEAGATREQCGVEGAVAFRHVDHDY